MSLLRTLSRVLLVAVAAVFLGALALIPSAGIATDGSWFDQFMQGVESKGYRVDFIAAHWYGADVPFGGYKESGVGREMGVAGFEEYLEMKSFAEPAGA